VEATGTKTDRQNTEIKKNKVYLYNLKKNENEDLGCIQNSTATPVNRFNGHGYRTYWLRMGATFVIYVGCSQLGPRYKIGN
jgi:hypothetical protein